MSDQTEYAYEVYISYGHEDEAWVTGTLLPRLQSAGLRVCVDYLDFRPGASRVDEVERAVLTSRKTLLVLSPAYLDDEWAAFGNAMVQTLDPASRDRRFIPLLKEGCELPLHIRHLTYVDFTRPDCLEIAWTQLLTALSAPSEVAPPSAPQHEPVVQRDSSRTRDHPQLRRQLTDRCSLSDLKDLCFAMGVDYDDYPNVKGDFIRELLRDLQNRGRVDEFVCTVRAEKPWVLRQSRG